MVCGGAFGGVMFSAGVVSMTAGLGRLIEHLRLFVALLFATDIKAETEGDEEESGRLVHGSEEGVVDALLPLLVRRLQPECPLRGARPSPGHCPNPRMDNQGTADGR